MPQDIQIALIASANEDSESNKSKERYSLALELNEQGGEKDLIPDS
jgi:hypothetical protein